MAQRSDGQTASLHSKSFFRKLQRACVPQDPYIDRPWIVCFWATTSLRGESAVHKIGDRLLLNHS
jgi:hypothetical protein